MSVSRRDVVAGSAAGLVAGTAERDVHAQGASTVRTGADVLAASGFAALKGKRVGLITNQTGRVGGAHLADLIATAPGVTLAAILAPEHGFRGGVEAGETFGNQRDEKTGAPVLSLYGATRKPTRAMLAGLDVLVFDIQDIGARFYTYISTMGLAMQAAAEARLPFIVLDRPNPLGGDYVSGFVLEPALRSFVGQYTIPIVHGLTVAELAAMIKGELMPDLGGLDLQAMQLEGWRRAMRWPETGLAWVPTSPNIPAVESALVYPGIGMVGELGVSEGRGTPIPFQQFGAPWLDAPRMSAALTRLQLPGLAFEPVTYVPRAIKGVASNPRFEGKTVAGVRIRVIEASRVEPLELGMHVLALLMKEARGRRIDLLPRPLDMLHKVAGTGRLVALLRRGAGGAEIAAAWRREVAAFKARRAQFLLY